jgi:hypothetical protein
MTFQTIIKAEKYYGKRLNLCKPIQKKQGGLAYNIWSVKWDEKTNYCIVLPEMERKK